MPGTRAQWAQVRMIRSSTSEKNSCGKQGGNGEKRWKFNPHGGEDPSVNSFSDEIRNRMCKNLRIWCIPLIAKMS